MSIKSKIQSLIAAANAKTGNNCADLTTAVQSLINGYGVAVAQISFTIQQHDGGEIIIRGSYTVNNGTTWAAWIGSGYTFDDGLELIISGGQVVHSEGIYQLQYNGTAVSSTDEIISDAVYTLYNLYA